MNEALLLHLVSQLETVTTAIRKEIGRLRAADIATGSENLVRFRRPYSRHSELMTASEARSFGAMIDGRKPRSDKGKPRRKRIPRKVKQAAK